MPDEWTPSPDEEDILFGLALGNILEYGFTGKELGSIMGRLNPYFERIYCEIIISSNYFNDFVI